MSQTVKVAMLTTIDNPYDPFTQFDEWDAYDQEMGYYSCAYLARIAKSSDDLSESSQAKIVEDAIDEICKNDVIGIYRKVTRTETIE